ncbi:MAG: hypothetical protein GY878_33485 [Fuerstiella sp.]|nr:hypothetical protein [Fuerstiella sp.]
MMSPTAKPAKPYNDFPLFAHPNGQWSKKIKGKPWYFGVWGDADKALNRYLDERDDIQAGRDPGRQEAVRETTTIAVADMLNLYLAELDKRCRGGDITQNHFASCQRTCKAIVAYFGRRVCAAGLKASDFAALRHSFPTTWGPAKVGVEIQRVRTIFKWAAESEIIPALPNFGPGFRKPEKRIVRTNRQKRQAVQGPLSFTATEIKTLLANSDGWMKAAILMGINAGYGNADCGRLRENNISFDSGWYDLPRRKTGIERRFYVWLETRNTIREAMRQRPIARDDRNDTLCFLTSAGCPVWWETPAGNTINNVARSFFKLCKKCKLYKPGRNFYSLRRTFETVAGATSDQPAVDLMMGHADDTMAAVYRQGIDDQRLIDVAEYVRRWLWTRKCDACGRTQFSVTDNWKCDSCGMIDARD